MKHQALRRRVRSIDTSNQLSLLEKTSVLNEGPTVTATMPPRGAVRFEAPDPRQITINQVRLDEHLKRMGQTDTLKVRVLLETTSFEAFERAYPPGGRPPYAPRAMVGLILYGVLRGISSLRDLEALARVDVGAWWVSGGIAPDHSIIGRFISRHEQLLTAEFFTTLTKEVVRVTGTSVSVVAGDGTVIEAAASRYRLMRQEALKEALAEAHRAVEAASANETDHQRLKQLETAAQTLNARVAEREAKSKDTTTLRIHPQEPEAVVQLQKDKKRFRPSYKPLVLANEARIIVGQQVHPSSETAVLSVLFEQAKTLGTIKTSLLDAGFFNQAVIETMAAQGIELLCPEGQSRGADWNKQSTKYYPKSQFTYDAPRDRYQCPTGQWLTPVRHYRGKDQIPAYVQYATPACATCPQKAACTKRAEGRQVKRYEIDAAKDALRATMAKPEARARYGKRQAMVEPVFSHLRGRQGLNRFRRRGLSAVRVEFALHTMAYNISRVLALTRLVFCFHWLVFIFTRYHVHARRVCRLR